MDDAELRALLAAQAAQIAALVASLTPTVVATTVRQIYDRYEAASRSRTSWPTIRDRLRGLVAALGSRPAVSLQAQDWTAYRATRSDLGPTTLGSELVWLKAMLSWAVREGIIPGNPLAAVREPRRKKRHNETAPLERDIGRLLADCSDRDRVIILCASDAGMRRSEIRSLEWSWIDRQAMLIHLPDAACKNKRGGPVPLTRRCLAALEAIPRTIGSPYVLTSPRGSGRGRYAHVTFSWWFRRLADLVGLVAAPGETVTLHSLRHSYGTNAAKRDVRIEIISKVYRHASLQQTLDYIATDADDMDAARAAFEAGIERDSRKR